MSLHDVIKEDGIKVFCNVNDFAETVTYHPFREQPRAINAVIERQQMSLNPEDGDILSPVFFVHVANDSQTGISSDELNVGGDQIEIAVRVGEQPRLRTIQRLLYHDEGIIDLECR